MTQDELRAEIMSWLREGNGIAFECESQFELKRAVHREFIADTGIFASLDATWRVLNELGQKIVSGDLSFEWRPRVQTAEFYFGSPSEFRTNNLSNEEELLS